MEVTNSEIMRYLKSGKNVSDGSLSALIEEMVNALKENITPKSVFCIYECRVDSRQVTFGGMTVSSLSLAKHLEGCCRAVLLAATLGAKTDILIRRYSIQHMEKTLIAQAVSAAMIEAYCDETEKEILQKRELNGLFSVTRYSPGYGDFDITCQKEILNMLGASRIGLSLTDGFMLTPSKSVTAVIGFSREQKKTESEKARCFRCERCFSCACCEDKNCGIRGEVQ